MKNINCFHNLPFKLGNEIGSGFNGYVYELEDKVIKLSSMESANYKKLEQVFNLIQGTSSHFVKVFDFNTTNTFILDNKKYSSYYYIMEKLSPISQDEEKVFHTILSHEHANKKKSYSSEALDKVLENLAVGLDFDFKEVRLFYERIHTHALMHTDIHPSNIMKKDSEFKLIDLDTLTWRI